MADKVLANGYGAILTIRVGSKERAFSIINNLSIPKIVSNIGDTKTLIIHPESTLNAHSTEKEKEDAGVFDNLIRISVGIEDIEDLIEDTKQGHPHEQNETRCFKSVGMGLFDVRTAQLIYEKALDKGIGQKLNF